MLTSYMYSTFYAFIIPTFFEEKWGSCITVYRCVRPSGCSVSNWDVHVGLGILIIVIPPWARWVGGKIAPIVYMWGEQSQ